MKFYISIILQIAACSAAIHSAKPLAILDPAPTVCTAEVGRFNSLAITNCARAPCVVNSVYWNEVITNFTPALTTTSLKQEIFFKETGTSSFARLWTDVKTGDTFTAGRVYGISTTFTIPSSYRGKRGTMKVVLDDNYDDFTSRCFEAVIG